MTAPAVTAGGKWDPTSPNLQFLAGTMTDHAVAKNPNTLIAVNELGDRHFDTIDRWCDERRILLDSGIFALTMAHARRANMHFFQALTLAPEEVEGFDELYDRYCTLATRFADRLWGVIELDQGGKDNKPRTRARIVADTGITPIPVYHPLGDGWDYYDDIASAYDRICFANLSKAHQAVRLRLAWTAAERGRNYPHLWTHLLGLTPAAYLLSMRFRGSCDSSAWLRSIRWSSAWRARSMMHRLTPFPESMTYDRDDSSSPTSGRPKAMELSAVRARFMQQTADAIVGDTHLPPTGITHP